MFGKLEESLKSVVDKIARSNRIDEATVNEIVKDIQRAMLQADMSVKLVMSLSSKIKERSLKEKPKLNPREHVINVVYEELVNIIGESAPIELDGQTIMMIGLQGSGKTTSTAKLARFFQKKGLKCGVIAADTFRPGAYDQLKQLCEDEGITFYGEKGETDAVGVSDRGMAEIKKLDVKIVDTAGRHALEDDLIEEMIHINKVIQSDHRFLVMDAAIGQQASEQARRFHEAVGITGIIITKLDGTAKGGGALSAVAETGSSIAFIGTGESTADFERFDPASFISRMLGMGDIKSLIERATETLAEEEIDVEAMVKGKFTLKDMYTQLEAVKKMGPLKQVMQMLPLGNLGVKIDDTAYEVTKDKLRTYKVLMDSMTDEELDNPKIIDGSRIKRVARGSGMRVEDVNELLKYHRMMQKAMKGMLGGGKLGTKRMMKKLGMG
ncbi:MAG: Signal recognition particle 54 kDa protein [Candidatus Syntrophoarchaeum sp. GoM_oil]|nr:MAG: Signal recognition particle 54 kDa protein [Candidatus Syntrophoarchaeum sp. GoM_oil]